MKINFQTKSFVLFGLPSKILQAKPHKTSYERRTHASDEAWSLKMSSISGLLSICRKAGKLVMGFDPMKDALAGGKAQAVIVASDISPKTEKEVRFFSGKKEIPVAKTSMTLNDVYYALGKKAGILTICDKGFAEKAISLCETENTDNIE